MALSYKVIDALCDRNNRGSILIDFWGFKNARRSDYVLIYPKRTVGHGDLFIDDKRGNKFEACEGSPVHCDDDDDCSPDEQNFLT